MGREHNSIRTKTIVAQYYITLPTKIHLVKAIFFSVVTYGCESWTVKKAECRRIDAFELWCWRRLLRVPWNAKRSNQPILKEISHEYSFEGLMLKLKVQYFGHQKAEEIRYQIANSCWIMEKAREFQKNIYFCFIDDAKAFDCVDYNKLKNSERDGNTRPPDLPLEKSVCRSGSNS